MSHWFCDIPSCDAPALIGRAGSYLICGQHLCLKHAERYKPHNCSTLTEAEQSQLDDRFFFKQCDALFAKIKLPSLVDQAKRLRPGHECHGPARMEWGGSDIIMHGGNLQVILTFDDGVKWLARIQQTLKSSPPLPVQRLVKRSEAATFKVLHSNGVNVPRVWTPPVEEQDELNYFFVEFVPGETYRGFRDNETITRAPTDRDLSVIESLARHQLALEKVAFSSIGSPTFGTTDDDVIIGPITEYSSPLAEPPYFLGPFRNPKERYLAYIETVMEAIIEDRWCVSSGALNYYLAMLEAKRLVEACSELEEDSGPFYIKHGEPKGDHLMVDQEGQITSVIDWEWSFTTSKADAFAAPLALMPSEFWEKGTNELSLLERALVAAYHKLGRNDLASFVENGKRSMKALTQCFPSDRQEGLSNKSEWRQTLLERYKNDAGLIKMQAAERTRDAGEIGSSG